MRTPRFIQATVVDEADLVTQAIEGLAARPAWIAPKFFYDTLGSRLFDAITALPEYYPTRTEAAIMRAHAGAMAATMRDRVGPLSTLIDLGAGNCEKARALFDVFGVRRYVAVDISADYLRSALAAMQREHPDLDIVGFGLDFAASLELPADVTDKPSLVFYPGSSIGNFTPTEAARMLARARAASRGGALLIGVDLEKDAQTVEPAYADKLGVTAAFNLNVLDRLNQLIGSDFDLAHWRHVAFLEREHSRIEMHLEATREQLVQWRGGERHFEAGERIHTEHSYKWNLGRFESMLRDVGFADVRHWTDERGWFAVVLAS
jgi:L-histidine Nalpha-methyltransferase